MQSYRPMLAKSSPRPFSHKDWLFEIKWDGFRAIAHVKGQFSLKSRNGLELKHNFPEISELTLLANNVVVDGELVIMKEGVPDFQEMQLRAKATDQREIDRKVKSQPATYVVFDLLEKDGQPLVGLPLIERKRILRESVKEGKHVCLADSVEKLGEEYYKVVVANGLEGVMAKKKDSVYEQGKRSDCWLKIKHLKTADCVIFGYTKGIGARESTFGSLVLGLYDEGKPVYVANVGSTGFSDELLRTLTQFFQNIKTHTAPFWVEGISKVTWVKPSVVCEVIYQSVTRDQKLRAPRFERVRFDKTRNECTIDQINEKSESQAPKAT